MTGLDKQRLGVLLTELVNKNRPKPIEEKHVVGLKRYTHSPQEFELYKKELLSWRRSIRLMGKDKGKEI